MSREAHVPYDAQPAGEISSVRGWWVATAVAPFGFLAPVGFAYAAHRARRPAWYVVAVAWGLLAFGGLALNFAAEEDSDLDGFSSALMLIAWLGALVHALAIRAEYVRRVRAAERDPVLLARRRLEERRRGREIAGEDPRLARELGIGRPDREGAEPMGLVDVNNADVTAIAELPGIDRRLAERIVEAREELDGFSSPEDLGQVLDLDTDLVSDLRERTVYLPR